MGWRWGDCGVKGVVVGEDVAAGRGGVARVVGSLRWLWTLLAPFLGLILITALFGYLTRESGTFLDPYNWRTIAVQTVVVGVAALGMTMVMISGGIDLSVGSAVALVTVAVSILVRDYKVSVGAGLLAGVVLGGLCGAVNGSFITGLRVIPFIITLGSLKVFRGVAKWLSSNTPVYIPGDAKPWWFKRILAIESTPSDWAAKVPGTGGRILQEMTMLAPGVWILLGLSLVVAILLRYSLLGRYVYAIGSNEATARLCGLRVPRIKILTYGLAGLATGLAGGFQLIYLDGTGDPTTAPDLELQVIAAVVIGGGSLSGGEGTVLGTLIGCLIMSVLNNGCVHAGISNASQDIIIGSIIVAAVALDRLRRGRAS